MAVLLKLSTLTPLQHFPPTVKQHLSEAFATAGAALQS